MDTPEKTLVIILAETRAWEKTYENIQSNVISPLNADVCVCIGVKPEYDYTNPFFANAKYRFTYNEPDDWADAFNYAETVITAATDTPITAAGYDTFENTNAIFGKLENYYSNTDNIEFLGRFSKIENILRCADVIANKYEEIVYHKENFCENNWKFCAYGVIRAESPRGCSRFQHNVISLRRRDKTAPRESWRRFLKIGDQFMGGVKDPENQHPGSAGILIFFRWFLMNKLKESGVIQQYDRFIITRSDYIWRLEHPKMELLPPDKIWVPDHEHYDGITDRHTVIPRSMMDVYCGLLNMMIENPTAAAATGTGDNYFDKMLEKNKQGYRFNLEKFISFHLNEKKVNIGFFPYVMFSIRPHGVSTRWASGNIYNEEFQGYIKYISEYDHSNEYLNTYMNWCIANPERTITDFYREIIDAPATL
jgi:hypothetical protein